jgi:hypothetical protein
MLTEIITIGWAAITGIIMATIMIAGDPNRNSIREVRRIGAITTYIILTTVIIIGASNRVA